MMIILFSPIQNQREVLVLTTLMTQVRRYISQMKELKDLTLPLMVKVVAGSNKKVMLQVSSESRWKVTAYWAARDEADWFNGKSR
jgi:hypothetical protein